MKQPTLDEYRPIVRADVIKELRLLAKRVKGWKLQNVNSTKRGGGVAEILSRLVPLLQELEVEASWKVIEGDTAFFEVTKAFHNALHGRQVEISSEMLQTFRETTKKNLETIQLDDSNTVIHDSQPIGLIELKNKVGGKWVWRCHVDVSAPEKFVWEFLKTYMLRYDALVFSIPSFARRFPVVQFLIEPSIDPLSQKNLELEQTAITSTLEQYRIDPEKPVILQVSRFDSLKDPVGVIELYRLVKKKEECQLVLAGGAADDDPEGERVLEEVEAAAADDPDIHVLLLPADSHLEINALQRAATVVVQKSIKEGFGLTVTEAMWKGKPVVASAVGGIRRQIVDGVTGFLIESVEGAAHRIRQILNDPDMAKGIGLAAKEMVRSRYLITRHVKDYLLLMLALKHPDENVIEI
ncbi:MAG: glycosyl transferase family 1 [Latescibacteria bacterium DG_63]|nr:MAG: glycosyl transferase family 1 [Latescibacteria bacterium DG_63]